MTKKQLTKLEAKTGHVVINGKCSACGRTGGDLDIACPGYRTAAELVDWSKQKPLAPHAKKKRKQ